MGSAEPTQSRTKEPRKRGRPASPTRRGEVLDLAAAMFAKEGYHGTSMRSLAERAQVNPASLYHYFSSKQEALFEVCLVAAEQAVLRIERMLGNHSSMQNRLDALLREHISELSSHTDYRQVYFQQRAHLSDQQRQVIEGVTRRVRFLLTSLFEDAAKAGQLRADLTPRQAMMTIVATMRALTNFYVEGPLRDYADVADGLIRTVIRGLSASDM